MESKPTSNKSTIDYYRLLTDDKYVFYCLKEAGLKYSELSEAAKDRELSEAAKEMILEDFRKDIKSKGNKLDHSNVNDVLKPYVNSKGNYQSEQFTLVPNPDKTFRVFTKTLDNDSKVCQKDYSTKGIEMRRIISSVNSPTKDIYIREDLVCIKHQRIDKKSGQIIEESRSFIDPRIKDGKTLELSRSKLKFNESEINTVKKYLLDLTELGKYNVYGEIDNEEVVK